MVGGHADVTEEGGDVGDDVAILFLDMYTKLSRKEGGNSQMVLCYYKEKGTRKASAFDELMISQLTSPRAGGRPGK